MEISLLSGVHLVLTIFDKENGKMIQYLSDSIDKFQAINQLKEAEIKQRDSEDVYVKQNIISEIYTNEHVSKPTIFEKALPVV
jgi:hypothetical protein